MKYQLILALSMTLIATTTLAELKPEDKITFRQSGYTFMRWNMGNIKNQVVEHPETYNKAQVIAAANVIAAVANSAIFTLFSPDTAKGKGWKETRVKPEFFKEPDEVKKLALDFKQQADKLAKVSQGDDIDMIKTQFEDLFKACKSCHKKFRTKD